MSRKLNCNTNFLAGIANQALTIDTSGRRQSRRVAHHNNEHCRDSCAEGALHTRSSAASSASTSSNGASTADSAIGDLDDGASTDSDKADGKDEEDGDQEAVIAPSDHAANVQAGQNILRGDNTNASLSTDHNDYRRPNPNGSSIQNFNTRTFHAIIASENDEDDDVYNNVDLISESDGEDPDIEQQEEANIINNFTDDKLHNTDLGDLNIFADSGLFPGDVPYFDDQIRQISYSRRVDDLRSYSPTDNFPQPLPSPPPPTPITATRRVRFDASALKSPCSAINEQDALFTSSQPFDQESDDSSVGLSGYDCGLIIFSSVH